jgi:hypothetical protein
MVDWLVVRHAVSKIEQPIAQAGSLIASYGFLSGENTREVVTPYEWNVVALVQKRDPKSSG